MRVASGIGRRCQYIDCRAEMGVGVTAGVAQRGTMSLARNYDVLVIGMSGSRRHVFKPVCEISMGLRERGIELSVMILQTGEGVPIDTPGTIAVKSTSMRLTPMEVERIKPAKVVIAHFGNVRTHIVYKVRMLLRNADKPLIVVCQSPLDFEDFAKIGVPTRYVRPLEENVGTIGSVAGVVTDVTRGVPCPEKKIDEIARAVWEAMPPRETEPSPVFEVGTSARYIPTGTKGVIEAVEENAEGRWVKFEGIDLWHHASKLKQE